MTTAQTTRLYRPDPAHWHVAGRPHFLTLGLAGAMPRHVLSELRFEHDRFYQTTHPPTEVLAFHRLRFRRIEGILDHLCAPVAHLRDPCLAQMVIDSLEWLEQSLGWHIPSAVVMPSHVHCLALDLGHATVTLENAFGRVQRFTARQANLGLGRQGRFWMDESFDHWCRHPGKMDTAVRYIENNPVKAGLVRNAADWPWIRRQPLPAPRTSDMRCRACGRRNG